MDTDKSAGNRPEDYGDEGLNTGSTSADGNQSSAGAQDVKGNIHNNALYAASMGRPATAQVNPHHTEDLAQTGTNISYEGPTAPGSGGSAGTGYTSGQAGVGSSIAASSDYAEAGLGTSNQNDRADDETKEENQNEQQ